LQALQGLGRFANNAGDGAVPFRNSGTVAKPAQRKKLPPFHSPISIQLRNGEAGMNAVQKRHLGIGLGLVIAVVLAGLAGCEVDEQDVIAAREEAAQEQQDVQEAIEQGQRDVREAQDRYETRRPPIDEDVQEAREEAQENIDQEQKEAAEAEAEAKKMEQQLAAQKERDTWVQEARGRLVAADARIEALDARAAEMEEGAEKDKLDAHLAKIHETRDNAEAAIDEVEAAEALQWTTAQPKANTALDELEKLLDEEPQLP
jgi:hypothetical protein